jgi:hypothetical protein
MKARLNLTIDNDLLAIIKAYAMNKNKSVSELVEDYFRDIARNSRRRKNIVDLVDKLDKPSIDPNLDLKDEYYKKRAGKYGF